MWYATSQRQQILYTCVSTVSGRLDSIMLDPVKSVRDHGMNINAQLSIKTLVKRIVSCCFTVLSQL